MTKQQKQNYLKNPDQCPFCGTEAITSIGNDFEFAYNQGWQTITCNDCHHMWREIFTLTDVEEI
jgi:formate dehydrogenase maturation protein FdhE